MKTEIFLLASIKNMYPDHNFLKMSF